MATKKSNGYLALPAGGSGPGVLVLHAWWGLNDTIKALCERLAEAGFTAFFPDLYRGEIAETIQDAEILSGLLSRRNYEAEAQILDGLNFLQERAAPSGGGVAVIGFSLGASYALDLAAASPDTVRSVILFYGTGGTDFSASRATYLGHFAKEDEYEPQEYVDALEETLRNAGRPVTFYSYPDTGHWFFEPDRKDAYSPVAAELAWERTLTFLRQTLN